MENQEQLKGFRPHLSLGMFAVVLWLNPCSAANYFDIALDPYAKYKKTLAIAPGDGGGDLPPYYKDVLAQTDVRYDITAETTGLIGEQIDLNSGAVSFSQTDLTIPGNSKLLPISVSRSFSDANFKQKATAEFADWSLDLPSIHTTVLMPGTANAGAWGKGLECSGVQRPGAVNYKGQLVDAPQYWNGTSLLINGSQKHLLYRGTADITYTTKDHWKATCFKKADGSGEGYKVTAPNGVVYLFEIPHAVRNFTLNQDQRALPIYHLYLRVSQITDPHGNWVKYKYNAYTNANQKISQRLSQIESNDGRLVSFTYHSQPNQEHLVKTISANGQQWQYQYSDDLLPALSKVTLPADPANPTNLLYWQYNLQELTLWHNPLFHLEFQEMQRLCQKTAMEVRGQIKHPHGAVAEFALAPVLHGRTQVPAGLDQGAVDKDSRCFMTLALQKKTLTGSGLNPMNWHYQYSENAGAYRGDNNSAAAAVQLDGYNSKDLKTTTVTAPDGSKTISVFFRGWTYQEGTQVGSIFLDTDGVTELKRQWSSYSSRPDQVGQPLIDTEFSANPAALSQPTRLSAAVIQLFGGGVHSYTTQYSQYNQYDVAEQWVETNTLSVSPRTTVLTHLHDTKNWILNLLENRQITQGAVSLSEYSAAYFSSTDPERSLLKRERRNGIPYRNFTYNTDGTVATITYDIASRWVALSNYKRGKPQSIMLPNRYDYGNFRLDLQQVNDNGTVAWSRDLNGNKTNYSYDSQNRLTLIDPADERWDNTTISYEADSSGKGALLQKVQQGNYRKILTLDALLQPILSKEWDAANETGTVRYSNQQFNAYGKPSFSSVTSGIVDEVYGVQSNYDGLQRIRSQTNTPQGDLIYSYEANNSIVVENGRGFKTSTQYLAYGEPLTNLATKIQQPEGVTTSVEYNIAGLPTSITQGGITEIRRYDDYMRFCIVKRPDTGMKLMERNTLGQVTRFAEGVSGDGTHCRDYTTKNANWVGIAYDNHGDLHFTAYADNITPTNTRQLDRQGNLLKLTVGNIVWDYSYNSQHLLETESLRAGAKNYLITNSYDRLGNLKSQQYGGGTLEYAPTALGLPTKVTDTQAYATQVQYHPGGALKSFLYGNGLKFSQSLNADFKPYERLVQKGAVNRFGQRYSYDNTDNVNAITDLVQNSQSITMSYDGIDRLDTASGSWGSGNVDYDALGNISRKQLGSQDLVYNYDNSSKRLQSVSGGYSFSYDDRGNVINNGKRSFSFDRANRLINAQNLSYSYDGFGRRVIKTSTSGSAYSVYNQAGKLLLTDGPNGVVRYVYLGNELIAKTGAATALEDKPGYTSHVEDKDLALTYMQQRYYDPVIGRFYSNDPVGFSADKPMMFNRYAYANNNPYKFTDPDGETPAIALGRAAQIGYSAGTRLNSAITAGLGKPLGVALYDAVHNESAEDQSSEETTESGGVEVTNDGSIKNAQVGDTVRTPENSKDFVKLKGNQGWKDSKTGDIVKKSNTNHSKDPKGEFKFGLKPNQPPTPDKKVTVTISDSKVQKIDK